MSKPSSYAGQKRLIQLSKEQEERMAAQSVQKIQAFVNEASQIQSRRCEVAIGLLAAHVTARGIGATSNEDAVRCKELAEFIVEADARQKFTDLKKLFVELKINGPQPHLEWAAKQVGVTLFDEPAAAERLIIEATVEGGMAREDMQ